MNRKSEQQETSSKNQEQQSELCEQKLEQVSGGIIAILIGLAHDTSYPGKLSSFQGVTSDPRGTRYTSSSDPVL